MAGVVQVSTAGGQNGTCTESLSSSVIVSLSANQLGSWVAALTISLHRTSHPGKILARVIPMGSIYAEVETKGSLYATVIGNRGGVVS
jgi:hypothetical protein